MRVRFTRQDTVTAALHLVCIRDRISTKRVLERLFRHQLLHHELLARVDAEVLSILNSWVPLSMSVASGHRLPDGPDMNMPSFLMSSIALLLPVRECNTEAPTLCTPLCTPLPPHLTPITTCPTFILTYQAALRNSSPNT